MQFIIPICLLCFLVLQQPVNAESLVSSVQSPDNEARRLQGIKRLRAPLMGRSNDDIDLNKNDSNGINNSHENDLIILGKRRYAWALLGRRKWMKSKRRGPLFG